MAVFIPLFSFLSLRYFSVSLFAGSISAGVSFWLLYKHISIKAATVAVVSIALGILFGKTLLTELWTYIRVLTRGTI
jgi:hypothetical protein